MFSLLSVFIGGGIGAALRYLFSIWANKNFGLTNWATFLINILGCIFLGFVATVAIRHASLFSADLKLFLTTGIAGGFTTFSTFSYENLMLLKDRKFLSAFCYMSASFIVGLAGIYFGFLVASLV